MNVSALIAFLLFTVFVAVASWYRSRKIRLETSEDYFLGNRSLSFVLVGGSLFLTNISGNQFIGENESVFINNMSVMAWGVTSVFAMLIVSEFFMPIYLRIGAITTPDFLQERFDPQTKKIVSGIFLFGYLFNLIPAVLYGGAVAFNGIFHFSEQFGLNYFTAIIILVVVMGIIGYCYSALGGLKIIAISDTILGAGMLLTGIILPYFGLSYLGNGSVMNGLDIILSSKTEHLNAIGTIKDAVPFTTIFTGMLLVNLYYWGMEQFIVQQALAAKNLKESQKGIALAGFFKLISPVLLNIPGLIAVHLYTSMPNTAEVFPRLVGSVLPSVWIGFTAAIVFGAALSTLNAGLNSSSTIFIMNLYKPWKEKRSGTAEVSEAGLVRTSKLFQLLIIITGMAIAPFIMFYKGGFYTYLQMVSGFFSLPVFTVLLIGFVTKKVPPIAAKVGIIFFVITYSTAIIVLDLKLHYLHIMAILFVVTSALMLTIGRLYPLKTPYQRRVLSEENRAMLQPWKHRHLYGGILIILMILMFVLFSKYGLVK